MKKYKKVSLKAIATKYKEIFMPPSLPPGISERRWWAYEIAQWLALILAVAALLH